MHTCISFGCEECRYALPTRQSSVTLPHDLIDNVKFNLASLSPTVTHPTTTPTTTHSPHRLYMPPHSAPSLPAPRILILYGSETGTAADLAHELSRLTERHHFPTTCLSASSLSPFSSLPSWPIVIFVTATTGQGDMPANMMAFWKFLLRKKLPADWLTHTGFTTFGCGDTGYKKFNWAVRKVHKRFLQLGGQEVAERGEGDEQHAEGWV